MNNKTSTTEQYSPEGIQLTIRSTRWRLLIYDAIIYVAVSLSFLLVHPSQNESFTAEEIAVHVVLGLLCVIGFRMAFSVYRQIWRYGGTRSYLYMCLADLTALCVYFILEYFLPQVHYVRALLVLSILCVNLVVSMASRMIYYVVYQNAGRLDKTGAFYRWLLKYIGGLNVNDGDELKAGKSASNRIRTAIVGAGSLGTALARELLDNPNAMNIPVCFIDSSKGKIGRSILTLPVISSAQATPSVINNMKVQEIIIAIPDLSKEERASLYNFYSKTGVRVRTYDYPITRDASSSKLQIREFEIEELLSRRTIDIEDPAADACYKGKVVMVTGGGGSIGSELVRQLAKKEPKKLIIVDFAENTTYDLQQELVMAWRMSGKSDSAPELAVEIVNICDASAMDKLFSIYCPEIVLHAAAHKHVPLMEHNCTEAVKNNVFGTYNLVSLCLKYNVQRFTLISSDKAVNPTNVMGATKRMCELIVQCAAKYQSLGEAKNTEGKTVFSAVRFGNVMGSAGSVIPLFRKQIRNGGPVTLTDKRIIRYFMTISEASHLVLAAGAMAENGELFVLDMGEPCSILTLAENMIRLSGYRPYDDIDIIETGLRPGEKLYEELLVKSETLAKTNNELIFIEKDEPIEAAELEERIAILREAAAKEDNALVKATMMKAVPTFHTPEEVNAEAENSAEMKAYKSGGVK